MDREVGRAVLYVDFDNVYLGLTSVDQQDGDAFANHPDRWVEWLEQAVASGGPRRFLQKRVYLNPATHPRARAVFTRSGFRAIDCPSLTGQGKNSADIYMALDIMEALAQPHHDEFVILSGDADFTPVLHRIRAADKTSTVVTGSPAAAAYRAVADRFIAPDELAAATGDGIGGRPPSRIAQPQDGAPALGGNGTGGGDTPDVELAKARIRAVIRDSPKPMAGAAVAQAAINADPRVKSSAWMGAGTFKGFLATHLPELRYESSPPPGIVFDPSRHRTADVPAAPSAGISPLLEQVCFVTGVPALSTKAYEQLFHQLAAVTRDQPFHIAEASRVVRDEVALSGYPIGRGAISYVVRGLAHAGLMLTSPRATSELATAWAEQVVLLAAGAQVSLNEEQLSEVRTWLGVERLNC